MTTYRRAWLDYLAATVNRVRRAYRRGDVEQYRAASRATAAALKEGETFLKGDLPATGDDRLRRRESRGRKARAPRRPGSRPRDSRGRFLPR